MRYGPGIGFTYLGDKDSPIPGFELPHGCLTFKYQRDVWEENRPQGDKFWLKWVFAF